MFRSAVCFVAALALSIGPALGAEPKQSTIDALVVTQMTARHVPGMSIAVEQHGRILFATGYGYEDTGSAAKTDRATYFEIGSITKQFTAAAIAMLVNDGKLSYTDTVASILPDVPHASEITVQELLNHTSGLRDYLTPSPQIGTIVYSASATPADLYGLVAGFPLDFPPGTQFAYSNTNYIVLGAIIEHVSGMRYADFLRSRVLHGTAFDGISYGPPIGKTVSRGYDVASPGKPLKIWSPNGTYAAGALYARATDIAAWDDAFFHNRVVPAATVTRLTTPPALPAGAQTQYAAGWIADSMDGHRELWHNGGLPGFNARNAYFPEQDLAIVVFANVASFDATAVTREIFRTFVPATAAQLAADSAPAAGADPAITARVRAQYLAFTRAHIDPALYAPEVGPQLPDSLVATVGRQLASLGTPSAFLFSGKTTVGRSTVYTYRVLTPGQTVIMTLSINADDKIDGIYFKPE